MARIAERANIGRAKAFPASAILSWSKVARGRPRTDRHRGNARPEARDSQPGRHVPLLSNAIEFHRTATRWLHRVNPRTSNANRPSAIRRGPRVYARLQRDHRGYRGCRPRSHPRACGGHRCSDLRGALHEEGVPIVVLDKCMNKRFSCVVIINVVLDFAFICLVVISVGQCAIVVGDGYIVKPIFGIIA